MGIHISSVAQVTYSSSMLLGVKYFIYLINYYDIDEEVIEKFLAEIPEMGNELLQLGNVVSVSSIKNIDYADKTISWQNLFGVDAEEVCPAILICTLPPHYFIPMLFSDAAENSVEATAKVPWVLLSLHEYCKTLPELRSVIQRVVEEVSLASDLSNFEQKQVLRADDGRPVINGLLTNTGCVLAQRDTFKVTDEM